MKKLFELEVGDILRRVVVSIDEVKVTDHKILKIFDFHHNHGTSRILDYDLNGRMLRVTMNPNNEMYKIIEAQTIEDAVSSGTIILCSPEFDFKPIIINVINKMIEYFEDYKNTLSDSIDALKILKRKYDTERISKSD